MASQDGAPPDHLTALDGLAEAPWRFDPFEALRRLEAAFPERPRLGESVRPLEDAVRIRQLPTLEFPASALTGYTPPQGSAAAELEQVFFGLFGANAPLPLHLTEYAIERQRHAKDPTLVAFANIFHHRFASLLYRAWASSRPTIAADRPDSDRFRFYLQSLMGLGLDATRDRDALPDSTKAYFAGRLAGAARNPEGLESIVSDYLGLRSRVAERVPEWLPLGPDVQARLGGTGHGQLGTSTLGVSATIGAVYWSADHRFQIVVGPLNRVQFESLLPDGERLPAVGAIVASYTGDELAWEMRLIVLPAAVEPARLGVRGRLGWDSWVDPDRRRVRTVDLRVRPPAHTN